jgi:SAGA-associated factor 29
MDPQISERLTELYRILKKISEENKLRDRQKNKSCKNQIANLSSESKALREALDVVVDIRQTLRQYQKKLIATMNSSQPSGGVRRGALMKILQQSASALPLFIPDKPNEPAPPLCGSIPADPSYIAKSGDMIAAFVQSPDGDGSKVWVLGEVLHYISGAGKYEIDDIDEDHNTKDRHTIGRRRVIPLPTMRANPLTNPEALFPKDTLVLALYPQTTCFYRAIIDKPPEDFTHDYMVSFEDATYTEGYSPPLAVPQRYVIASREPKK